MNDEHVDVVIVGAGLAGIGIAAHIARTCPEKRYLLLERRRAIGGTWDLFRYPGVRSDTDVYSFGYEARPWHSPTTMADGASIRDYIAETARESGIDENIRYGLKVTDADWSSTDRCWTLTARHEDGRTQRFRCDFLIACTGYYDYDAGFLPDFPGAEKFSGRCVHPQRWPEDLDWAGRNIVVIGSGATAVTLVPALAAQAAHVTMLQRSPSYIVSLPNIDMLSNLLRRFLPESAVYRFARKRFIALQRGVYLACRRWPKAMRGLLLSQVRKQVGKDVDMKHFTPNYMPWDQRVCAVPDGDLFETVRSGKASVVTDQIEAFNERGVRLKSGQQLDADIIVTATGLVLQVLGGMKLSIDGEPRTLDDRMTYKGVLVQDVPNFATVFGYANAPWTLKVDLVGKYVCRLLRHMTATGQTVVVPREVDKRRTDASILNQLSSGYVQRGDGALPRQGDAYPWRVTHHFGRDRRDAVLDEATSKIVEARILLARAARTRTWPRSATSMRTRSPSSRAQARASGDPWRNCSTVAARAYTVATSTAPPPHRQRRRSATPSRTRST